MLPWIMAWQLRHARLKARLLGAVPSVHVHTDSTGSEDHNMRLSERRAEAVYNHLLLRDIDPTRMAPVGYGEGYPVADNSTPAGRQLNRRVSILIRGKA